MNSSISRWWYCSVDYRTAAGNACAWRGNVFAGNAEDAAAAAECIARQHRDVAKVDGGTASPYPLGYRPSDADRDERRQARISAPSRRRLALV